MQEQENGNADQGMMYLDAPLFGGNYTPSPPVRQRDDEGDPPGGDLQIEHLGRVLTRTADSNGALRSVHVSRATYQVARLRAKCQVKMDPILLLVDDTSHLTSI